MSRNGGQNCCFVHVRSFGFGRQSDRSRFRGLSVPKLHQVSCAISPTTCNVLHELQVICSEMGMQLNSKTVNKNILHEILER